jgi:hypothetical protein
MCSAPDIPAPPPPPQEQKAPDTLSTQRTKRKAAGFGGGTMLTGPSGVASGSLNTGGATLLGG